MKATGGERAGCGHEGVQDYDTQAGETRRKESKVQEIGAELQATAVSKNSVLLRFDLTSATIESNSVYS